jgi:hypothetical protein
MKTNSIIQLLEQHKIVIPPIQRDYAQGRNTGKIPRIRERFLGEIVNVLKDDSLPPMELDFVYGYIEKDRTNDTEISVFKPLDGQQRLTTLFLAHWYVAKKELKMSEAEALLKKFSYATRYSSRLFCEKLITFIPEMGLGAIDEQIINQPWFQSTWLSDPTIASMLVVLKDIEARFENLTNVWVKLTAASPRIVFHLLPMEELGLPEDLYIKMNARGKPLTDFEHFKSQFSDLLKDENAKSFANKVDKEWSDLFWNIFKDSESDDIAKEVDNGFLSFFWFITDLLVAKKKIVLASTYWLHTVETVYRNSPKNVEFLFNSLNLFEKLEKQNPNYFDELFYIRSEDFGATRTRLFFINPQTNLFRKCAETYGFGDKKNSFSVGEQLLLYAFIYMNLNAGKVDKAKFRLLRNIFSSSEDQLRNEYLSTFLYADVETIIEQDIFSVNSKLSKRQFEEERRKGLLLSVHPDLKDTVYKLEDHTLLRGNIALFELDTSLAIYAEQFHNIFVPGCNYFGISKAMLTLGDYTQGYGKFRRFGNNNNSTWREIFTQSESRKGFEITRLILSSYLDHFINNPATSNELIIQEYLSDMEKGSTTLKDFRFYYIKYPSFTFWNENQTDGFYWWNDYKIRQYECTMLFKTNYKGRHWSPFLLQLTKLNIKCTLENYGNDLQYTNGDLILLVKNFEKGYMIVAKDSHSTSIVDELISRKILSEEGVLEISQDTDGTDVEDRIVKCTKFFDMLSTINMPLIKTQISTDDRAMVH